MILMMDSATVLEHTESYTPPRDDEYSSPVGWIRGHTKIGPLRQVKVTYHSEQLGIEIQVKSMKNDESFSWIVISKGMNKYVEESNEEKGESSCHEEMASGSGIGKPIATKQKGQSSPQSYLVSKIFVPIDQQKWNDILAVNDVIKGSSSWSVSRIMTKMLRHQLSSSRRMERFIGILC